MEETNRTKKSEKRQNTSMDKYAQLEFRCPQCGSSELLAVGAWANEIKVFINGEVDWGEMVPYDDEDCFCCAVCGYELHDEQGCKISHVGGVIRWLFGRYVEEIVEKFCESDPHSSLP